MAVGSGTRAKFFLLLDIKTAYVCLRMIFMIYGGVEKSKDCQAVHGKEGKKR